jgi:hypothetical protein
MADYHVFPARQLLGQQRLYRTWLAAKQFRLRDGHSRRNLDGLTVHGLHQHTDALCLGWDPYRELRTTGESERKSSGIPLKPKPGLNGASSFCERCRAYDSSGLIAKYLFHLPGLRDFFVPNAARNESATATSR